MSCVDWLREQGGEVGQLIIKEVAPENRTLVAETEQAEGAVLVRVPDACLMTLQKAQESKVGRMLAAKAFVPHSAHVWLAIFLLEQRALGAESFWARYIEALPRDFPTMPLFQSTRALADLKGSFAYEMAHSQRREMAREYAALRRFRSTFDCSAQDYLWARAAVLSRVFPTRGFEGGLALVPVVDMANHSASDPAASWEHVAGEGFVLRARRALCPGDHVSMSYGPKCNSRYLLNYGFVLPDNEAHNQACVFVKCNLDAIGAAKRSLLPPQYCSVDDGFDPFNAQLLHKRVRLSREFRFKIQAPSFAARDDFSKRADLDMTWTTAIMLRMLRVLHCTQEEMERLAQRDVVNLYENELNYISHGNELLVMQTLVAMCDRRLLALEPISDNGGLAETMKQSEARVLHKTKDFANFILQNEQDAKALLNNPLTANYITSHWPINRVLL